MKTNLKFWLMPNAGFETSPTIETEIKAFEKLYPDIKVKFEIFSWTRAWFKLIEAIKERNGPDVIQIGSTWISALGYLGALGNIESGKNAENDFVPFIMDTCRFDNRLIAMPWFCDARVLFYRKDYLEKAGFDISTLNTWDDFKTACEKLKSFKNAPKDYAGPFGFSCHKEQVLMQDIAGWIWGQGGNFLSEDSRHSLLTAENTVNGIQYLLDLLSNGIIPGSSIEQSSGEAAEEFFLHDAFSFLLCNSWPMQVFLSPKSKRFVGKINEKNFGVTVVPSGPKGRFNFSGGSSLSVTSFTDFPNESYKLVEFLTSKESSLRYCKNIKMLSAYKEVDIAINETQETQNVFARALNEFGKTFPKNIFWGSIEQIILGGIAQSLREFRQFDYNDKSFYKNLSEINNEIDHLLSVFGA
jgi:multiple sugar transport system substrate-binding protein